MFKAPRGERLGLNWSLSQNLADAKSPEERWNRVESYFRALLGSACTGEFLDGMRHIFEHEPDLSKTEGYLKEIQAVAQRAAQNAQGKGLSDAEVQAVVQKALVDWRDTIEMKV